MFESDEHRELFEANHTAPPEKVDVGGMASANTVLNGMWTMNGTSYDRPVYYQDPDVKTVIEFRSIRVPAPGAL